MTAGLLVTGSLQVLPGPSEGILHCSIKAGSCWPSSLLCLSCTTTCPRQGLMAKFIKLMCRPQPACTWALPSQEAASGHCSFVAKCMWQLQNASPLRQCLTFIRALSTTMIPPGTIRLLSISCL